MSTMHHLLAIKVPNFG